MLNNKSLFVLLFVIIPMINSYATLRYIHYAANHGDVKGIEESADEELAIITIPKLHISAKVESIGVDDEGNIELPKNHLQVGFNKLGPKPGEKGHTLITGFTETPQGNPGAFRSLGLLSVGDIVEFISNNKRYTYQVIDKTTIPVNSFPLLKLFTTTDKSYLDLITNISNPAKSPYPQRTIIKTVLK